MPVYFVRKETPMSFTHADRAMLYRVLANQEDMFGLLNALQQKEDIMAMDISNLTATVARETEVDQSAVVLLGGLKTSLDAAIAHRSRIRADRACSGSSR